MLRTNGSLRSARFHVRWFSNSSKAPRLLVWGGNGALGKSIIQAFKGKQWETVSVDYKENNEASKNIVLSTNKSWKENALDASTGLEAEGKFAMMVNTAGAWVGGTIGEESLFENFDRMVQFNSKPSLALSHLAKKHLADGGTLVLTGAEPALRATPNMVAYGLSKQIVHSLVGMLSKSQGLDVPRARVVGILPLTIDTEANRAAMPTADRSTWTPPSHIADKVIEWAFATSNANRPVHGGLYRIFTKNGTTRAFLVRTRPKRVSPSK